MTVLPALALGFTLGLRHAMDADHIAAVSTISTGARSTWRAALLGASWGAGHSISVLLVGGALVIMRLPMPARLALALEFLVAIMLVALGMRSLMARQAEGEVSAARPLLIGVVHGLAGSAVLAFLLLSTASSPFAAAVYLLCFSIGTIAGMAVVTTAIALPARIRPARAVAIERTLRVAAGVASIGIGLALAHRVGIRDGLFAAVPPGIP
jgi:predicted membrane-bound spermidine synthase